MLGSRKGATAKVMTTFPFHAGDVPHCLSVEIGLSDEMVFNITKEETVLTLWIDEVTHALCVVEF